VGGCWLDAGPPQRRAVLAALAVEAGRPLLTEALIDRVWGERPPGRPRAAVHAHITLIRRLLKKANDAEENQPPVALVHRSGSYLLRVDPMCVDLLRFRDLVASARDRQRSDTERARLLHDAVDLWRSPALADLPGAWPERMRESWGLERLDAAVDWARSEVRLGHHEQVISPVRALAAAYPVAEPLVAVLMQALAVTGRVSEALDCYATARTRLADLLGADPGAELRDLHQVILRGDLEQLRAAGAPLGITPSPAPQVLWGPVPPRNLFFTGREQALADLHARLTGPTGDGGTVVAVSALAGMGGVGKTQLAAEYAHRHAGVYRLVWWINAETPTQAVAGLAALANALGLPAGVPAQRQARLWEVLARRDDWLLVYDNATDPGTLATILPPRVTGRILITSRARLPRLPTVDVSVFDRAESVALLHHHLPELPTADADRLAATLADLPLAVDQAGAYLTETPLSVDAYLHLLADQPQLALAEATPDHAGLAAVGAN
jgi:DNA-binding SARP family transcriptional activator